MEKEKLTEYQIQIALPAPNEEIAKEVANKAQALETSSDTINS